MRKFKKPESRGRPARSLTATPPGRCVVGIHAVTELLKVRPRAVDQIWLRESYSDHPALRHLADQARNLKIRVHLQSPAVLDKVTSANQGVLAFAREAPELDWEILKTIDSAYLVALDEVEDPHNLGAVLRTAWLLGARGVLTPAHRSAHLSPAVSKVAQGAVEHVPVDRDNALPQQLETLKSAGFWIWGLSHTAKSTIFEVSIPQKVIWVLGSEASGLRKSVERVCDDFVRIPQLHPEASYNVSVAAAIALAETFRQMQKY
ncbi:MAG: TrmH family RNA methyltransferase [Bdellovibrionales bacterium]